MLKRLARRVFPWLPAFRAAVERGQWREIRTFAAAIGLPAAVRLWFAARCLTGFRSLRLSRIRPAGYDYPLYYRAGGSDARVIEQVLVHQEYAAVAALPGVEFIIDCGANIGCTTFYLLHRYPLARAVVVEPDAGNMAVCRRNLVPFRDRVTFVEAGVWPVAGPLVVDRGSYRDGAEWSIQVRPARPGEKPDVNAVTVPDLLAAAGFPRIDLLKIDIEGAEAELFDATAAGWLNTTRNLVVELHGPACERAVDEALAGFRFDRATTAELTIFLNLAAGVPRCT